MMRPAKLTMTWSGDASPIRPGVFLHTAKGKRAYEITAVREVAMRDPEPGVRRFRLTCERWPIGDVPDGATRVLFEWTRH